jgi:hypothetical protein
LAKEDVNPYYGKEIPFAEELGLKPNTIYQLYRPAEEIALGAPTANGIQLMKKHVPIDANDHKPYDVVGTLGTNATFEKPYLRNSLVVWAQDAIDDIEADKKKELSMSYHYRAEMTPGVFDGKAYDGIMRGIIYNHCSLVTDGRAGPDVVVGDSKEILMTKPTRFAALTLALTAAGVMPLLAKDQKIELPKDLFASITTKNFKETKPKLVAGVKKALDGKLRKGLAMDASLEHITNMLDQLEDVAEGGDESVSEPQHKAMEAAAHGHSTLGIPESVGKEFAEADKGKTFDAEPFKAFLKEKGVSDEDIEAAMDMLPKGAKDEDTESEEDKEKRAAAAKEAEDKRATDSKKAMDAAIRLATDSVTANFKAVAEAERFVRPWVGELPPQDNPKGVFRAALSVLGQDGLDDIDEMDAKALKAIISLLPKPGDQASTHRTTKLAADHDATGEAEFAKNFPNAARVSPTAIG